MQLKKLAVATMMAIATAAAAQSIEFTNYLGKIYVGVPVLPLAGDSHGDLFYGSFDGPNSTLYKLESPETKLNTTATQPGLYTFSHFVAQRGLQSLQITPNNDIYVAGDTGDAAIGNLWHFEEQPANPSSYALDVAFAAKVNLSPARRSSVAYVPGNGGADYLIAGGFNNVDTFALDGSLLSGGKRVSNNYAREGLYNSADNVYYVLRNGVGTQVLLQNYLTNVNPLNVGDLTTETLIANGGSNGALGSAKQNGFYYADQNQLITLDGDITISGKSVPPKVRVWDITDSGTSLTLAYSIEGTSETEKFLSVGDATVINNRLYVSSSGEKSIYVFGPAPAAVHKWKSYESTAQRPVLHE